MHKNITLRVTKLCQKYAKNVSGLSEACGRFNMRGNQNGGVCHMLKMLVAGLSRNSLPEKS